MKTSYCEKCGSIEDTKFYILSGKLCKYCANALANKLESWLSGKDVEGYHSLETLKEMYPDSYQQTIFSTECELDTLKQEIK